MILGLIVGNVWIYIQPLEPTTHDVLRAVCTFYKRNRVEVGVILNLHIEMDSMLHLSIWNPWPVLFRLHMIKMPKMNRLNTFCCFLAQVFLREIRTPHHQSPVPMTRKPESQQRGHLQQSLQRLPPVQNWIQPSQSQQLRSPARRHRDTPIWQARWVISPSLQETSLSRLAATCRHSSSSLWVPTRQPALSCHSRRSRTSPLALFPKGECSEE